MKRYLPQIIAVVLLAVSAVAQQSARPVDRAYTAADALFRRSDVNTALRKASLALQADRHNTRALFVAMEASALQADDAAVLGYATRLCAAVSSTTDEDLCEIAAGRISELAANTRTFRDAVPRIQQLIASGGPHSGTLQLALVAAASDGAPEFDLLMKSRESGLLTDWKIVGPLGRYANGDFDRALGPEQDSMRKKAYGSRRVSNFQFVDGKVELPDASRSNGVFYAAARTHVGSGGEWRVWVDSPGTLEVFVDGVSVLRKDDRSQQQPQVTWKLRRMEGGPHTVVVKFLPSALPFRVAIMRPAAGVKRKNNKPALHAGPEGEYASVALRYWRGDYAGVGRQLQRASRLGVASSLLLARAWQKATTSEASEARAALLQASADWPDIAALQLALAEHAVASDRIDEALSNLKPVLTRQPDQSTALRLFAQLASRLHWRTEAANAYERLARLHPSCQNIRDAAWYLAGSGEYARAQALVPTMRSCAPGSLLYAQWLARSGRHAEAARAAVEVATRFPLHREALVMQASEAQLAGDQQLAESAVATLVALGSEDPPLPSVAAPAENPRAAGFYDGAEFYTPYRRDGLKVVRDLESRKFSGGPAVMLLHDKVASLAPNGRTAVYVHIITRVLNREGIEKYGEVAIPSGADLLELRTIKSDGTLMEPELNQHKATISMPALSPGDAIELEYVTYHSGAVGVEAHRDAFEFVFGSFAAPILISRFVVISPEWLRFNAIGDVPRPTDTRSSAGLRIRTWVRDGIPQSINEGRLPSADLLPLVRATVPQDNLAEFRSAVRETAISASRVGLRASLQADALANPDSETLARALYARTIKSISRDGSDFTTGEVTPAEESLASREGSRTAVLLALARASRLRTSLALARTVSNGRYTHPLVVFHLPGRDVVTDPESDEMPFGVLGPSLDRSQSLLVPLDSTDSPVAFLKLQPIEGEHLSIAEGDITFDQTGTFTARVTITMGAWRATQMRNTLRTIPRDERRHFFEQLAMRLFPGASDADGAVQNETTLDQPLRLEVTCTSRNFLDMTASTPDIDQLVPTLGLRKMYALRFSRQWPLFVDSLLFESAFFRVRLPDGIRVVRRVNDLDLRSEFGTYRATFTPVRDGMLEIRREFRIPVQVVPAARYGDFAAFANRIDETERQRLTLGIDRALLSTGN